MQIVRFSGRPVTLENLEAHAKEFKVEFDKIEKEHSKDMLAFKEALLELDVRLGKKYGLTDEVPMPKTMKAFHALIDKYQGPILVAKQIEDPKQLVLVIMDESLN